MNKKLTGLLFGLFLPLLSFSQSTKWEQLVSLDYQDERLGYVLSDISQQYQIVFSYSSSLIPVGKEISITVNDRPLTEALDDLFATTRIVYTIIGEMLVLSIDPEKPVVELLQKDNVGENSNFSITPLPLPENDISPKHHSLPPDFHLRLARYREKWLEQYNNRSQSDFENYPDAIMIGSQKAQVTLFPALGSNGVYAPQIQNNISFNLLWGVNGGLDGLEIGTLANFIKKDMSGFQLAGGVNSVNGEAEGVQVALVLNYAGAFKQGIQFGGLANVAKNSSGIQLAGLLNISNASTYAQYGLGINVASSSFVRHQIGLVNLSGNAKGRQIGLVNWTRYAEKPPIGLINLVKGGYNNIELGVNEVLHAQVTARFGTRSLYSLLIAGSRFDGKLWGTGAGIGRSFFIKKGHFFNLEVSGVQLHEEEFWTSELNLLCQIRLLWEWQPGDKYAIMLGPNLNIIQSRRKILETEELIGSNVPYYTLANFQTARSDWKGWIGLHAGFRF